MLDRIFTGWTFPRFLYLGFGCFFTMQSIIDHQWMGVVLGSYVATIGIFAYGCAAGNCSGISQTLRTRPKQESNVHIDIDEADEK